MSDVSGIRAKRIEAENVVDGVQMRGDASTTDFVELARALQRGGITADEIVASNVITGLQYIGHSSEVTLEQIRKEIDNLATQLSNLTTHDAELDADIVDVRHAVAAAMEEVSSENPGGRRLTRKLREASDALVEVSEVADNAHKLSELLGKLAAAAAVIGATAAKFFGLG